MLLQHLSVLFFAIGVSQRSREIGILHAVGYELKKVRRRFLFEGITIACHREYIWMSTRNRLCAIDDIWTKNLVATRYRNTVY